MTTDESLRRIEHRAALLRHLADQAAHSEPLEPPALSGLGYALDELAELARRTRATLTEHGHQDVELGMYPEEIEVTTSAEAPRASRRGRRRTRR